MLQPRIQSEEEMNRRRLQEMVGSPAAAPVVEPTDDDAVAVRVPSIPVMRTNRQEGLDFANVNHPDRVKTSRDANRDPNDLVEGQAGAVSRDVERPEDTQLDNVRLEQALKLMLGGNHVTQEDLDRTRTLGNSATAEEGRAFNARLAAGGFGASGIGAMTSAGIAQRGALQTDRAVQDMAAGGRAEELNNILSGAGLSDSGRTAENDALVRGMLRDMLGAEVAGDAPLEPGDSPTHDEQGNPIVGQQGFGSGVELGVKRLLENGDPLGAGQALYEGQFEAAYKNFRDAGHNHAAATTAAISQLSAMASLFASPVLGAAVSVYATAAAVTGGYNDDVARRYDEANFQTPEQVADEQGLGI